MRNAWTAESSIWPSASGDAVSISAAQMAYMLEGIDWRNPPTDVAADKGGMSGEKCGGPTYFGTPQITKIMIHFVSWMLIAPLLPKKTPR